MSSEKKQDNVKVLKKNSNNGKDRHNLTWILSVIFLILVVAVFVLSPVARAFVPSKDSIVFGEFDGKPIEYAPGNYFYDQQQRIASSWKEDKTDKNYKWQIYQIWKKAFDNTVIHTAISMDAKKSGVFVTDDALDSYLLKYGPYIDENGKFSSELYAETSDTQKQTIRDSVRDSLLYQTVINDLFSSVTSPKEIDFIKTMAKNEKSFDYLVFPLSDYPQERVVAYVEANALSFTELNISMITLEADDEDAANSIYSKLTAGDVLFEDAARNNSIDGFAKDGGEAGWLPFYDITQIFDNDDSAHELFSLAPGSLSKLYKTQYGYTIFRVNEGPRLPDLKDEKKLDTIKNYMIQKKRKVVEDYMRSKAEEFAALADSKGFKATAAEMNLAVHSVAPTPLNYNSASFMQSFTHTDTDQYLTSIIADASALKSLYNTPAESLSQPLTTDSGVILAYCTGDVTVADEDMPLSQFYPYLVQQVNQNQFTKTIFSSDKLTDNFLTVFFAKILKDS